MRSFSSVFPPFLRSHPRPQKTCGRAHTCAQALSRERGAVSATRPHPAPSPAPAPRLPTHAGAGRTPSASSPALSSREEVRAPEVPGARAARGSAEVQPRSRRREGEAALPVSAAGTAAVGALEGPGAREMRPPGPGGAAARGPLPASDWGVVAGSPPCCVFRPVSRPSGWWERSSCRRRSFSWSGHPSGISLLWPTPRAR